MTALLDSDRQYEISAYQSDNMPLKAIFRGQPTNFLWLTVPNYIVVCDAVVNNRVLTASAYYDGVGSGLITLYADMADGTRESIQWLINTVATVNRQRFDLLATEDGQIIQSENYQQIAVTA